MRGLTSQEVNKRVRLGQVNIQPKSNAKSIKQILIHNIFNYFNVLNLLLAAIIISTGAFKNVIFLFVLILNTSIAIFQEVRSKLMVERLTLLSKNKIQAIRDDKPTLIDVNEIVLDDLIWVETGVQIPVDCELSEGNLEMDESNLTGESLSQMKGQGDYVYSGSVVVSGTAFLKVKKVGKNSYANRISSQVKAAKSYPSKLKQTMNAILRIVTYALIPIGILMLLKNKFVFNLPYKELVLNTTAPLVGTIPEGLILITSIALAVSVYALGKKNILVQELYCTEGLARVDVLCVDKTGTITEGSMEVVEVVGDFDWIMPSYLSAFDYENASERALINRFGKVAIHEIESKLDFSSRRKYSSVTFKREGTFALGAFEILVKNPTEEDKKIVEKYTSEGYRILAMTRSEEILREDYLPEDLKVLGFVIISDVVRENTKDIFEFFKNEGVHIKIISGDNPVAVGAIARKAGLMNVRPIDVSKLSDEELKEAVQSYNVFGRVSPDQKKLMVEALQSKGHTVAMTGDGVNDVLALRQADVSIAMAQGCDAAKQISNIVLLENNFKNLYDILMEGRRVINNIQRVSTLFLTKTAMSVIFSFIAIVSPISFPFIPIQLTLISALTIGLPGFVLTLEKSRQRISENFMSDVLIKSFLSALVLSIATCVLIVIEWYSGEYTLGAIPTMAFYLNLINGICLVVLTSLPLNKFKSLLLLVIVVLSVIAIGFMPEFFQLVDLSPRRITLFVITAVVMVAVLIWVFYAYKKKRNELTKGLDLNYLI